MKPDADDLLEVAGRVSDGLPVEWGDEPDKVRRHLRLVEAISRVHRSAGEVPGADPLERTATGGSVPTGAGAAPERWGRLEIREKLGEGGFGEVYRAWDPNLDREVALKLQKAWIPQDDERARAALREGRMLARVRHPHVITVYGAEIHDGRLGLWMELVQGHTVAQLLEEQGRYGAREAALVGIDLCRALSAVHAAGLIHRDVKAANAMRSDDGRILLMDFGAGIEIGDLDLADTASISGTPLYIAPEVYLGQPATQRSDLYAVGVLLYYMVTGAYPVDARTLGEVREKHRNRTATLLRDARPDLPESFLQVVERALAWDPQARFETAGQMERALAASFGIEAPADEEPAKRGRHLLAAAAAVALLLAGAWAVTTWKARPGATSPLGASGLSVEPSGATYSVQAALHRVRDGERERLDSGDALAVGDRLSLDLTASRDLYVYIFNEDEQGSAYTLFPLPGFELQNPIPGGRAHELPGLRDGLPIRWEVTTAGQRERLVVLASPEPLEAFERELARLPLPAGAIALPLPAAARERLRGIGGLAVVETPPVSAGSGKLFEMARRLSGQAETVEGVWMREIELVNEAD